MALQDLSSCIDDCTQALSYLAITTSPRNSVGTIGALPPPGSERRKLWCVKTVARRGAARLQQGDYHGAAEDFRMALRIRPGDEGLEKDLKEVEGKLLALADEQGGGQRSIGVEGIPSE